MTPEEQIKSTNPDALMPFALMRQIAPHTRREDRGTVPQLRDSNFCLCFVAELTTDSGSRALLLGSTPFQDIKPERQDATKPGRVFAMVHVWVAGFRMQQNS
jgi:hypothetical protein